jgi:rhodanese-related sulfurtransferase
LGIAVRAGTAATHVSDDGQGRPIVDLNDGTRLPADLVIVSAGVKPDTAVFEAAGVQCDHGAIIVDEHGRTNLPHVWAVGDATASVDAITGVRRPVALAGPAGRAGRKVADGIGGKGLRSIPRPLGTAIVRVGELAAALTGANRAGLEAAGRAYTTLHVHPHDHAAWFPGAKQMHLLVHIDPATGELLGAQGVGAAGVDKRIDVIATAMRGGLRAPDLIDLDLCYAPPYGAAKDPVTMVGLVADNVLSGQTRLWQAGDWERAVRESLVLDVRSADEFAGGHLVGAVNIPHTELRGRLQEVRERAGGRPVAVVCQSGVRSYIAHRILAGSGFESATLSGGMLTLRAWLGAEIGVALSSGSVGAGMAGAGVSESEKVEAKNE